MQKINSKQIVIIACVLVVLIAALALTYTALSQKPEEGMKTVTVEVISPGNEAKTFKIKTDELYLRGALEQEKLVSGDESTYGLYVKVVCGIRADETKQYWAFSKNGEYLTTGVDTTPIYDGDKFEITLSEINF